MNVSAIDKATNKSNKITITNQKGRFNQSEIDKLVKEAEKYKADDDKLKKKIEAKNGFENYLYSVRNSFKDEKLKDKFTSDEKDKLNHLIENGQKWLENHQDERAEEYEKK